MHSKMRKKRLAVRDEKERAGNERWQRKGKEAMWVKKEKEGDGWCERRDRWREMRRKGQVMIDDKEKGKEAMWVKKEKEGDEWCERRDRWREMRRKGQVMRDDKEKGKEAMWVKKEKEGDGWCKRSVKRSVLRKRKMKKNKNEYVEEKCERSRRKEIGKRR